MVTDTKLFCFFHFQGFCLVREQYRKIWVYCGGCLSKKEELKVRGADLQLSCVVTQKAPLQTEPSSYGGSFPDGRAALFVEPLLSLLCWGAVKSSLQSLFKDTEVRSMKPGWEFSGIKGSYSHRVPALAQPKGGLTPVTNRTVAL